MDAVSQSRLNSLPSVTSISSSLFARSVRRITRFLTMTSSNVNTTPRSPPAAGALVAPGSNTNVGAFIEADLEGLSVIRSSASELILLASVRATPAFRYRMRGNGPTPEHLVPFDRRRWRYRWRSLRPGCGHRGLPEGVAVVVERRSAVPGTPEEINGYEVDGATQFLFVNFEETLQALWN